MSKEKEFNGYNFGDKETRKRMRYLIVIRGDLDLNNAYAFKSKKELESFLKDISELSELKELFAVFEIKDLIS